MLVHREQTPVALRTVHVLKGRRARSLPFYDPTEPVGTTTRPRYHGAAVQMYRSLILFLLRHEALAFTFFQTIRKSGIVVQKILNFGS